MDLQQRIRQGPTFPDSMCQYLRTDAGNIRSGGGCVPGASTSFCYASGSPLTHGEIRQYSGGLYKYITGTEDTAICG